MNILNYTRTLCYLKKTTHFLLAGMLILTGVYTTASDSNSEPAQLKTPEQQERAENLLKGTTVLRQHVIDKYGPNLTHPTPYLLELQACQTYRNNLRYIEPEHTECEEAFKWLKFCVIAAAQTDQYAKAILNN